MNVNKAKIVAESVESVIFPKFYKYIEDRKSDISLDKEIEKEIKRIERITDFASEIPVDLILKYSTSDNINLYIGDLQFFYDQNTESLELQKWQNSVENMAKNTVWSKHGLTYNWSSEGNLRQRILAVVSMLDEGNFDDILKVVETNIDFNEFIVPQK